MKNPKSLFILLLFVALIAVVFSCGKKNQDGDYGVSISAPKLVGTPAEAFSVEDINTLKITNSLNFLLLNQTNDFTSFSFCPQSIARYIFSVKDSNYISSFKKKFSIQDTNILLQSLASIADIISTIDSTISVEDEQHITKDSAIIINQKFNFPLIYKDALHTSHKTFASIHLNVGKKGKVTKKEENKQMDFYTISANFGLLDNQDIIVCDIPIGNGSYSLMLVQTKQEDILSFARGFSEQDYKNIIDKLQDKFIQVSFPNITQKTTTLLHLPQLSFDSSYKMPSMVIHSKVRILKPQDEQIKTLLLVEKSQDMINQKPQSYLFAKPFLFLIRGKSSNSVILSGLFFGF